MNRKEFQARLDECVAIEIFGEEKPQSLDDAANAEKLDQYLLGSPIISPKGAWNCHWVFEDGDVPVWRPLPFSTSRRCALEAIEKLRATDKWCCISIKSDFHYIWRVEFYPASSKDHIPSASATDESFPMALCLAAIQAVRQEP